MYSKVTKSTHFISPTSPCDLLFTFPREKWIILVTSPVQWGKIDSHNLTPFAMPTQINGDAGYLVKIGSQSEN